MFLLWHNGSYDEGLVVIDIDTLDVDKTIEALTGWDHKNAAVYGVSERIVPTREKAFSTLGRYIHGIDFYDLPEFEWEGEFRLEYLRQEAVARWQFARAHLTKHWLERRPELDVWEKTLVEIWKTP